MENPDHLFRELLDRYLKGTATPAERERLEKFFESYQKDAADQDTIPDEALLHDKLLRKIHRSVEERQKSRRKIVTLWMPIAAAIAVFVLTYFFTDLRNNPPVTDTPQLAWVQDSTGPGQRIIKILPDGSTAHLNHRTTITYPKTFGSVREISISGEGFFEVVSNGKPFIVCSGEVRTQVLGTSFNVKHREGSNTEITLVEGKVNVISSEGQSLDLEAGEQALVGTTSGSIAKRRVNVMRYAGWKDNILLFEQTTFDQATREIEEWYAVNIEIANPSLSRCRITAKYQNEPLGNVLSSLEFLLGLNIRRMDDTHFLVDGKGCK